MTVVVARPSEIKENVDSRGTARTYRASVSGWFPEHHNRPGIVRGEGAASVVRPRAGGTRRLARVRYAARAAAGRRVASDAGVLSRTPAASTEGRRGGKEWVR